MKKDQKKIDKINKENALADQFDEIPRDQCHARYEEHLTPLERAEILEHIGVVSMPLTTEQLETLRKWSKWLWAITESKVGGAPKRLKKIQKEIKKWFDTYGVRCVSTPTCLYLFPL